MSKLQLLSCYIALGGDTQNVVHRHRFNPVTYPELLVLKFLHGELAVTRIFDVGYVERDDAAEFARLGLVYGTEIIRDKLFPGAGARLPHGDNRFAPEPEPVVVPQHVDTPADDGTTAPGVPEQADYTPPAAEPEYVPAEPAQPAETVVAPRKRGGVPASPLNAPPLA